MVLEPAAVPDAGERVVIGEVFQRLLKLLAGFDLALKARFGRASALDEPGDRHARSGDREAGEYEPGHGRPAETLAFECDERDPVSEEGPTDVRGEVFPVGHAGRDDRDPDEHHAVDPGRRSGEVHAE